MDKTRKQKLLRYLFPTQEIVRFMFLDLYVELIKFLPKKICFSNENLKTDKREENLKKAKKIVKDFIKENCLYKKRLYELFPYKETETLINDILIGYIIFLTPQINKCSGADVFNDKRSVCYSKYLILNVL